MGPQAAAYRTVAILIALILLPVGALFLYWPTVLGGGYDIEITAVTVDPAGQVHFEYNDRLAYGMRTDWRFPLEPLVALNKVDTWTHRKGPFRWPRRWSDGKSDFNLILKGYSLEGGSDPDAVRRRVLIGPGTYHLGNEERLVIYRAKTLTGELLEGYIRVSMEKK